MLSNYQTFQQHHNTTFTNSPREQRNYNKNIRPAGKPSSIHSSTSYQEDPFANMNAYVDYQQKIESLKTSLVSHHNSTAAMKIKQHDPARMARPLNSTRRHHLRRESYTMDIMTGDDAKYWSSSSVMSSGGSSSSGASSSGYLTPPRSSSPMTTTTTTTAAAAVAATCDERQTTYDSNTCYVTMEDQARFLAFLRHRTGWYSRTTATVTDMDYMKNSGSLFFWYG